MKETYSSDKPIKKAREDSFNRAAFAQKLASTMLQQSLKDGYVIGLYSQWGYGKTSTINMIEEELKGNKNVVLIKFNPWLFTDQQTMISGLFNTLAEALDKELKGGKEKVGDLLKKYSGILSPIPKVNVSGASKVLGDILSHANLDDLKQRVEKIISTSKKRIVVVIDDVDRLDKDELFQLFKLIKVAIDFKNVVYIIAFDDKIVGDALGDRFLDSSESGQSFIEKIIQIPLHLPMIDQRSLTSYLLSGIDEALENQKIEIDQDEINRFRLIFDEHIAKSLQTPRMANRYLNSLKFVLPLVGDEINAVDLLIIEAVRMLYPEEYKKLRQMKNAMSGTGRSGFMDEKEAGEKLKKELEEIAKPDSDLLGIITELFPVADNAMREYGGSYIDRKELKRLKRIAASDYFDRYFTYGIPMGDVSDTAVLEAIELGDAEGIAKGLAELIRNSSPEAVIGKLRSYEDELSNGKNLAIALTQIADLIPEPAVTGLRDTPLEESTKMMLVLIGKLSNSEKTSTAKAIITKQGNLDQLAYFLRWVSIMSDPKKQDKVFDEKQKTEILKFAARKIRTITKGSPIFKSEARLAHYHYHTWADVLGDEEVKKQLASEIKTYEDVCDFLTRYASVWYGSGAAKRGEIKNDSYQFLRKVVDPDHLYKILLKQNPKLSKIEDFPEFDGKVNLVGNEKKKMFRDTISQQFAYTHNNTATNTGNEERTS